MRAQEGQVMAHGHIAREWQPRAGNGTMSLGSQTTSEEGTVEALNRKMLREPWMVPFQSERRCQGPAPGSAETRGHSG